MTLKAGIYKEFNRCCYCGKRLNDIEQNSDKGCCVDCHIGAIR